MCQDFFDDFGWEEMALAGSLAEEMAEDARERRRLERESEIEMDECGRFFEERDPCDPPEEPFLPSDEEPYP